MNDGTGIITGVLNWIQHPFNKEGSALNWILFVGLLVIAAFLWNTVLLSIQNEI